MTGDGEHRLYPPAHVGRYSWEARCSCGWSRERRTLAEAEAVGEAHLEAQREKGRS